MSRARNAFSAASRSYSAMFKEIDDSPDVLRHGATRAITNARSKFGLDLHARHSRRVNKMRRTYNSDHNSEPISIPLSAGGSYNNSEDEASPLRGGEARTPEFAPEYGPSDTPGVPPAPPRRASILNKASSFLTLFPLRQPKEQRPSFHLFNLWLPRLIVDCHPHTLGLLRRLPTLPQILILGWTVDTTFSKPRGMTLTAISCPMPPFRVPDRNPSPPQSRHG